ncbi:hypothetical protein [Desulforhabdus sp. TSK]|uniref:hypothetical protein n=1 Tax=Desulforhabdus sp. TSK TaxID=2925014 RepID=UPI001FC8595B|nr:hypothetical protein [Desulforhabdus sp. TSK]
MLNENMVPMLEHPRSSNLATLFLRCKDESLIESFSLCQAAKSAGGKILQNNADEMMPPPRKGLSRKWKWQARKERRIVRGKQKENALVEIFLAEIEG